MLDIYDKVCIECSRKTTRSYSTSFSLGTRFLSKKFRDPVYAVYGFVRFADEIVDTFHNFDKAKLFSDFKEDTWKAIRTKVSMNPILHSFQQIYHKFNFEPYLVETFLHSMEMDLDKREYSRESYEKYILGSAEVVGLMCLKIFTEGHQETYEKLKPAAMKLGAAFQKINFLRDLNADFVQLGRSYFPGLHMVQFNDEVKHEIECEIEADFKAGYEGILQLPKDCRLGVYVAYVYYQRLFRKIQNISSQRILEERVRIPNRKKFTLFLQSYLRHSLNLL
jgi:phytoene/squalene synthetase